MSILEIQKGKDQYIQKYYNRFKSNVRKIYRFNSDRGDSHGNIQESKSGITPLKLKFTYNTLSKMVIICQ